MDMALLLHGLETAAFIVVSVILISQLWLSKKVDAKRLPAGSYGLPLIGETLKYMASMKTSAPTFMAERKRKFGEMFKSKLMGAVCIITTKADTIKWVLAHDGKQFVTGYPKSFRKVLGEYTALSLHGEQWKSTRRFLVNSLRVELLKERIPMIEARVLENLSSWANKGTISIREETKTVSTKNITQSGHRLVHLRKVFEILFFIFNPVGKQIQAFLEKFCSFLFWFCSFLTRWVLMW